MNALVMFRKDPLDLRDIHFDNDQVEKFDDGKANGFIVYKANERLTFPIEQSVMDAEYLWGYITEKYLCVGVYNGDVRYEGRKVYKPVR